MNKPTFEQLLQKNPSIPIDGTIVCPTDYKGSTQIIIPDEVVKLVFRHLAYATIL